MRTSTTNLGVSILVTLFLISHPALAMMTCKGVLANSGGEGDSLVKFGQPAAPGLGAVVDRWGFIWDRLGKGTLGRLAADGRLVAKFVLPTDGDAVSDRAMIVNDTLVLLLRNNLYTLPCDAIPGSKVKPLKQQAKILAPTAWQGRALVGDENALAWLNPATGERTLAGPGFEDTRALEVGPDGTIYVFAAKKVYAVNKEKIRQLAAKPGMGDRPQLIEGYWFCHAWHSTISRFDQDFAPVPGVVLGGNSGSFIGHVSENQEIILGRGLTHLSTGEWVIGNHSGGCHLLEWDPVKTQFNVLRRISGLPALSGLVLDDKGRVDVGRGFWNWEDNPDTPMREYSVGVSVTSFCPVRLDGLTFAAVASFGANRDVFLSGSIDNIRRDTDAPKSLAIPADVIAVGAIPDKGGFLMVGVVKGGSAFGLSLGRDGSCRKSLGKMTLNLASPTTVWTSLAADSAGHLLAAADGQILVLERDGAAWKEIRRWSSWSDAPADHFGSEIWLQVDGNRLWVSDTTRQRVLVFDLTNEKLIDSFGEVDHAGTDLAHLDLPRLIAPNGNRCVVHDAANQRLLKLELK